MTWPSEVVSSGARFPPAVACVPAERTVIRHLGSVAVFLPRGLTGTATNLQPVRRVLESLDATRETGSGATGGTASGKVAPPSSMT